VIAYLDSSAILRVILGQPDRLAEWPSILNGVTSALSEVECARTIDRLRVLLRLTPEQAVATREAVETVLQSLEVVAMEPRIFRRAMQPRPEPLGTLDALHLATAEAWRDTQGKDLVFATHDRQLALAARGSGFKVAGV
jgi:predicted nucleic acid-binding protein